MKGAALFGILVVSILIMGGSFYYFHEQDQKILPKYSISLDFKDNSSFNASYPIILSGVPSGSGTYQQLITLNNYSKYGINSQGSNLAFYDAFNLTHLYAWIQSINSTSLQVWVKNYNASNVIDMQVLPSFENVFSTTGYLGEAPELSSVYGNYDNGKKVFNFYTNWANKTFTGSGTYLLQGYTNQSVFNDGVIIWSKSSVGAVKMATTANYNLSNDVIMTDMNLSVNGSQNNFLIGEQNSNGLLMISSNNAESSMFTFDIISANSSGYDNVYGSAVSDIKPFTLSLWQEGNVYYDSFQNNTFSQTLNLSRYFSSNNGIDYFNTQLWFYIGASLNINETQHYYWLADRTLIPDGMPTFTIGSAYHPLSSFSISSNSLVVNTTFTERNLTAYQYYAFSPVWNQNPVWFLVDGQVGDRLSVLLDSNVSLTVQILGYSFSNVIKEVKVE